MKTRPTPLEPCLWASQRLSLRLDGEISEFEQARLEDHLRSCADCRALAADLEGLTRTLRTAAQEEPATQFRLPRRRYVGAFALRAVSATAAVAVMGVSGLIGLTGVTTPNSRIGRASSTDVRVAREQLAVKERQLDNAETAGRKAAVIRPGLARAEKGTVGGTGVSGTVLPTPSEGR